MTHKYEVTMDDGREFVDIIAHSKEQAAAKAVNFTNLKGTVKSVKQVDCRADY